MYMHNFKYNILYTIREKTSLFWTLVFPIALATFMYLAFGKIYETTEKFNPINVAAVKVHDNQIFEDILKEVSKDGDDKLLNPVSMTDDEAKESLENEDVYGIIYIDESVSLSVKENGIEQTILTSFINQYVQTEAAVKKIAETNPAGISAVMEVMNSSSPGYNEKTASSGNADNLVNYFYAVFAMSCLFAAFVGITNTLRLQANLSELGARRAVAPTKKSVLIITQFISSLLIQFIIECIAFVYMLFVLGINFGDKYGAIILTLFIGSALGLSMGMLIGALPKPAGESAKMGLGIAASMALSVLADLCANGVKNLIEHNCPIINRINPAALITDAFYSLNSFDTYERFTRDIVSMLIITAIFIISSIFIIRRNRYASI